MNKPHPMDVDFMFSNRSSDKEAQAYLGGIVQVIGRKSAVRTFYAVVGWEHGWVDFFWLMLAALGFGFIANWLFEVVASWTNATIPLIDEPFWGPLSIAVPILVSFGFLWLMYTECRPVIFVLHRNGFRFRDQLIRFDDISLIWQGRPRIRGEQFGWNLNRSIHERVFRHDPTTAAAFADSKEISRNATVNFELRDGGIVSVEGMLVVFKEDDVAELHEAIRQRRPELFSAPAPEPTDA